MFNPKRNYEDLWTFFCEKVEAADGDECCMRRYIDEAVEEFDASKPCDVCGSRLTYDNNIYSATRDWVLEVQVTCRRCKKVFEIKDKRKQIRQAIEAGRVQVKDLEILKQEVEIPVGQVKHQCLHPEDCGPRCPYGVK